VSNELWLQLEGITPDMDLISIKFATEAILPEAVCPSSNVNVSTFEQFSSAWLLQQASQVGGATCSEPPPGQPNLCVAECSYGGGLEREAELIVDPAGVNGSIVRVRLTGTHGASFDPMKSIVTTFVDDGPGGVD
jgi:hypothetical protein